MSTCRDCFGSGYGGHPDSGIMCWTCGGNGDDGEDHNVSADGTEVRVITCEYCEGDGRLEYGAPRPPHGDYLSKRCNYCNGTGKQETVFEPITLDDLEELHG